MPGKATLARWISIAGHPFVLVPLAIVLATSRKGNEASRTASLTLVAISMIFIAIFVARRLRRGEITDVDVSTREHRPGFYVVALVSAVLSTIILQLTHQAPAAVRGSAISAVLLVVGAIANTRIKVSLHTAFALMAAGIAANAGPLVGIAFVVVALVVAWARVAYSRHTLAEVIGGGVLGVIAGLAQAWAPPPPTGEVVLAPPPPSPLPPARIAPIEPWEIFTSGWSLCVRADKRGVWCGDFLPVEHDGGRHLRLELRREDHVPEDPSPYVRAEDGRISVREGATDHALRERAIARLPKVTVLAASDYATCALTVDREVWCWPEPRFVSDELERPPAIEAKRVPGLASVTDIVLMPWLTLCARTSAGDIACSEAPARATAICVLRGESDVGCGPSRPSTTHTFEPDGTTYDPRRVLERPLVKVPGVAGASWVLAYPRRTQSMQESPRHKWISGQDEGGCTRVADGSVLCFERDPCGARRAWRSARVEGLPQQIARVSLGSNAGYAVDDAGAVYRWSKHGRADARAECPKTGTLPFAPVATRADFTEPVHAVGGGTFSVIGPKMISETDCAALVSGGLRCWQTAHDGIHTVDVRFGGSP